MLILLPTAWQHWRRYRLGRDRLQLGLTLAATLSIGAISAMQYGDALAHVLVGLPRVPAGRLHAGRSGRVPAITLVHTVDAVLETALSADPLEHIAADYPEELPRSFGQVEEKDAYTYGHSSAPPRSRPRSVHASASPPEDLRELAQGAYLHDVGKITIPDEILNKPGRLDTRGAHHDGSHAPIGADLVAQAPSLRGVRRDRPGPPRALRRRRLPRRRSPVRRSRSSRVSRPWPTSGTRSTSDRAYRPGWPRRRRSPTSSQAGNPLRPHRGRGVGGVASEWGYRAAPTGDADEAWRAGQDCHEAGDARVPVLTA